MFTWIAVSRAGQEVNRIVQDGVDVAMQCVMGQNDDGKMNELTKKAWICPSNESKEKWTEKRNRRRRWWRRNRRRRSRQPLRSINWSVFPVKYACMSWWNHELVRWTFCLFDSAVWIMQLFNVYSVNKRKKPLAIFTIAPLIQCIAYPLSSSLADE